jgi:BirA family biotin operon repressor/biotin-[acetyl-CoA-carboxylase] ligase
MHFQIGEGNLGRYVYFYDEVTSTNDVARRLAEENASEGTVVVSRKQSNGRGRNRRHWFSPVGGLWFSLILRPRNGENLTLIPLLSGVAGARAIMHVTDLKVWLKWPNDLIVENRKLGGILVETMLSKSVPVVIVGVGINVRNSFAESSEPLRTAISLHDLGREIEELDVLKNLMHEFEWRYELFNEGSIDLLLNEWHALSCMVGKMVSLTDRTGTHQGIALGVDVTGALLLKRTDGSVIAISSTDAISATIDAGLSEAGAR